MATVTFIKYQKQSAGSLRGVAGYVSQAQKTRDEDGDWLVSGQNCTPQLAAQEFMATRQMHHKDSPVWFYHYVQSFHPQELVTGKEAHQLAQDFARQAWPDSEVLIATHTDAQHIHSHFIVNAVCYQSGKMLRQGPNTLKHLRTLSDALCEEHGLSVLPRQQTPKSKGMNSREYRSAAKGESWKFRLVNTIDQCMRYAASREEFISLMKSEGYQVRWTDGRKSITYTTPQGLKCRDDRLHEEKYTKEVMEHEFAIRAALVAGGVETTQRPAVFERTVSSDSGGVGGDTDHPQRSVSAGDRTEGYAGRLGAAHGGSHSPSAGAFQRAGVVPHPGEDGGADRGCGPNAEDAATGWEKERAAFYSALHLPAQTTPAPSGWADLGHTVDDPGGVAASLVGLGRRLEQTQSAAPVRDATTTPFHTDRKTRRRQQEKKIALGHKADDHEDKPTWEPSM